MPHFQDGHILSTPDGSIAASIVGPTLTITSDIIVSGDTATQVQRLIEENYLGTAMTQTNVSNIIWTIWNQTNSTSTSACTWPSTTANSSVAWRVWNGTYSDAQECIRQHQERSQVYVREEAERRQAWVAAEGERAKARERAAKLLQENLSAKQKEELAAKGYFSLEVISKDGGRRTYQIHRGRSGNVKLLNESGRIIKSLCCHPIEQVPDEDTMLAQKLYLEAREEDFLRIANHTNYG